MNIFPAKERATIPELCTQDSSSSRSENCGTAGGVEGEKGKGGRGAVADMGDEMADRGEVGTIEEGYMRNVAFQYNESKIASCAFKIPVIHVRLSSVRPHRSNTRTCKGAVDKKGVRICLGVEIEVVYMFLCCLSFARVWIWAVLGKGW